MKKGTKILSLAAALMLGVSAFALTGCGEDTSYKGEEKLADYQAAMASGADVASNGGFAVEKGGYVYFINGVESTTANNGYGAPVKCSLMAIKKSDLAEGNYDQAKIVIPSLFTAQDFNAGLYIFGDYVYYATPTTDKNVSGQAGNSYIDFKRAKLDGTEAPMSGYYFRLPASATYRFVQVDGVDRNNDGEEDVFCLYEEDKALKSYNTATGDNVVLVKNAKSSFFYDKTDATNPNVYYTMDVKYDMEKDNSTTPGYDQIYCVNAAAQVTAVDAGKASYTVSYNGGTDGRTYDFDEKAMNKNAGARGYDLGDYTTYPYVNLGQLVLDGVGFASTMHTHYNEETAENITDVTAKEAQGYNYTIKRYETNGDNAGIYFTRTAYMGTEKAKLYYVDDSESLADGWNTVNANNTMDIVAHVASDVPDASVIEISTENGKRVYTYMYVATETAGSVSNTVIKKAIVKQGATYGELTTATITMTFDASGATLWKTNGDYLYYYTSGSKGKNLSRINYTGDEDAYNTLKGVDEYKPTSVPFVEYNNSWYQPEFIGDTLLYANAQNYASNTTNFGYVYAAKIGTTEQLLQAKKDYETYTEYLAEYESGDNADSDVAQLIKYLFGCELEVTEEAKAEYIKKFNKANNDADSTEGEDFYNEILAKFDENSADYIKSATAYTNAISRMTESDVEKINEAWDDLLLYPEEEEPAAKESVEPWIIWVSVIAGVVIVAAAVIVPVALHIKKKKAAKREADAIVNSYKRQRIDTTDDKTIDVYADENAAAPVEEPAETAAEEPVAEPDAEPVAEETEEPAADAEQAEKDE